MGHASTVSSTIVVNATWRAIRTLDQAVDFTAIDPAWPADVKRVI